MPPNTYDPRALFGQYETDLNVQYDTSIPLMQEILRQKQEEELRLKEEALRNPERSLAQALTQAFSGAIPGLIGGAVGGQRGAGYGLQAGGDAARDLGLFYDEQDKENKLTRKGEYINAVRDRQIQEQDIEELEKEKRGRLGDLGFKKIEAEGRESEFQREETRKKGEFQERQDLLRDKFDTKNSTRNLTAHTENEILEGQRLIEELPDRVNPLPGAQLDPKVVKQVTETVDSITTLDEYIDLSKLFVIRHGPTSLENLPVNSKSFQQEVEELRSLLLRLDPNDPRLKQGLNNTEREQMYNRLGSFVMKNDWREWNKLRGDLPSVMKDIGADKEHRMTILNNYLKNRRYEYLPPTKDPEEINRRSLSRQYAKQQFVDRYLGNYDIMVGNRRIAPAPEPGVAPGPTPTSAPRSVTSSSVPNTNTEGLSRRQQYQQLQELERLQDDRGDEDGR